MSAFAGTDLELILRANDDIDTLVVMGIATEVHACLVEKVFPRQATVVTASEVLEAVG